VVIADIARLTSCWRKDQWRVTLFEDDLDNARISLYLLTVSLDKALQASRTIELPSAQESIALAQASSLAAMRVSRSSRRGGRRATDVPPTGSLHGQRR
jgi:hypothetical protein